MLSKIQTSIIMLKPSTEPLVWPSSTLLSMHHFSRLISHNASFDLKFIHSVIHLFLTGFAQLLTRFRPSVIHSFIHSFIHAVFLNYIIFFMGGVVYFSFILHFFHNPSISPIFILIFGISFVYSSHSSNSFISVCW